jgi:hypothetical protein
MTYVPVAVGVKVSEQLAWPAVAAGLRLQVAPLEKLPAPRVTKLTVPVGALPSLPFSLTVAVQVAEAFTVTEEGEQLTLVSVLRMVAATVLVSRWKTRPHM